MNMTIAEAHALRARKLLDEGAEVPEIAWQLGVSTQQAERIVDRVLALEPAKPTAAPVSAPKPRVVPPPRPTPPPPAPAPTQLPTATASKVKTHGTAGAYQRHYQVGEKPCQECKDAFNERTRARRSAKRATKTAETVAVVERVSAKVEAANRQRVQIRWLVPRGINPAEPDEIFEYAVQLERGRMQPISPRQAEQEAQDGQVVYRRTVSKWQQVSP